MSVEKTLLKVDADLAAGDTAKARQRLTSLVRAFPERLDVRERLAQVCRQQGDLVQAGRWGYLCDERTDAEVLGFEKVTPDPVRRMLALQWPSDPTQAGTSVARERLEALLEQARAMARDPHLRYETVADETWTRPASTRDRIVGAVAVGVVLLLLLLFVVGVVNGLVTVASWWR